jgi:hypothetical protein
MKQASTGLRMEVGTEGVGLMNPCATSFMPVLTPRTLPSDATRKGVEIYERSKEIVAMREAERRGSRGGKVMRVCRTLVEDDDIRGELQAFFSKLMHALAQSQLACAFKGRISWSRMAD